MTEEAALTEIRRMLPACRSTPTPPDWLPHLKPRKGTVWRVLDDIAFLIRGGNRVITVYARGTLTPRERERRRHKPPRRGDRRGRRPRVDVAPAADEV